MLPLTDGLAVVVRLLLPDLLPVVLTVLERLFVVVEVTERVLVILRVCVSIALKDALTEGDLLVVAEAVSLPEAVGDPVEERVEDELRVPVSVITYVVVGVELSELLLEPLGDPVRVLVRLWVRVEEADSVLVCVVDRVPVDDPEEQRVALKLLEDVELTEFVLVAVVVPD